MTWMSHMLSKFTIPGALVHMSSHSLLLVWSCP